MVLYKTARFPLVLRLATQSKRVFNRAHPSSLPPRPEEFVGCDVFASYYITHSSRPHLNTINVRFRMPRCRREKPSVLKLLI